LRIYGISVKIKIKIYLNIVELVHWKVFFNDTSRELYRNIKERY